MIRDNDDNIPVTVFVKSASGSEIASKLSGYFVVKGQEFRFTAIAFGRIGGHNASIKISKTTLDKIAKMGIDPEQLQITIQRKLIEGDIILPEGSKPTRQTRAPSSALLHVHLFLSAGIVATNSAINFFVFSTFLASVSIISAEVTG